MNIPQTYEARSFWCGLLGIVCLEQRQLIQDYNSTLKFAIFDERNGKHNRLHFHALIDDKKVASVYLDNLEIDFLTSKIKKNDKKKISKWVEKYKDQLIEIYQNEDGTFEIPFINYKV